MAEWLTVFEVAEIVGVSEESIRRKIKSNKIKKIRKVISAGGKEKWLINEEEIINLYEYNESKESKRQAIDWKGITVLKMGAEIRIIVEMECPCCGGVIPMIWQEGTPKTDEIPKFLDYGRCSRCRQSVNVSVPRKTVLMWWYLAKKSIIDCMREDAQKIKHMPANKRQSGSKSRKKRKTESEMAEITQSIYGWAAKCS